MLKPSIRTATPADAAGILAIYAPYVTSSAISFDESVPEEGTFAQHIDMHLRQYPWLVAERRGAVAGYAYASQHRARAAYRWCVETSIYLAEDQHGTGLAPRLYHALFDLLRRQGFMRAYAGITLPNPKSVGFHRRFGFQEVGVYKAVGYKHGAWRDVVWLEYAVQDLPESPAEPVPFGELKESV